MEMGQKPFAHSGSKFSNRLSYAFVVHLSLVAVAMLFATPVCDIIRLTIRLVNT